MLRREVITDPIQIKPVKEQVRLVVPWWRRWLFTLILSGCTEPVRTVGDAVDDFAVSTCIRQVGCGWTGGLDQQSCETQIKEYLCDSWNCSAAFKGNWDGLHVCLQEYESTACEITSDVCEW